MDVQTQIYVMTGAVSLCGGLIVFIVNGFIAASRETKDALAAHLAKCAEVPKEAILATLKSIVEKQDSELSHFLEFKTEIKTELAIHREQFVAVNNSLFVLVGRQQQKDFNAKERM